MNSRNRAMLALTTFFAVFTTTQAFAETRMRMNLRTGEDDLRSGSSAFLSMILMDGSRTSEFNFSNGLSSGSNGVFNILFPETFDVDDIRAVRLRYDGSPDNPFDTHDNWDVRSITLFMTNGSFEPTELIYNSFKDTNRNSDIRLERFTGQFTRRDFFVQCRGSEPDFEIIDLNASPRGRLAVTLTNVGCGRGIISRVECFSFGRAITLNGPFEMAPESTGAIPLTVNLGIPPSGTLTCAVVGTDLFGNPERVTANNRTRETL